MQRFVKRTRGIQGYHQFKMKNKNNSNNNSDRSMTRYWGGGGAPPQRSFSESSRQGAVKTDGPGLQLVECIDISEWDFVV